MHSVASAYRETETLTASPERLHLMVVEGAIRFARQGAAALEAGNFEAAFHALSGSRSCVNEIICGIVDEPNPELAVRLRALFVFVQRNLAQADLLRNPQLIGDALAVLESHRATWLQLIERLRQERSAKCRSGEDAPLETSWTT